jgi:hypothetical protein
LDASLAAHLAVGIDALIYREESRWNGEKRLSLASIRPEACWGREGAASMEKHDETR